MNELHTIYVRLLDEGVDVWRPAVAYRIEGGSYILLRPRDYDPQFEHWEFPPGTAVEAEARSLEGAHRLAAVRPAPLIPQIA